MGFTNGDVLYPRGELKRRNKTSLEFQGSPCVSENKERLLNRKRVGWMKSGILSKGNQNMCDSLRQEDKAYSRHC